MFRSQRPLGAARRASRGVLALAAFTAALFAAGCGKDNTVAPGPERPYLGMVANPVDAYVNDADSNRVVLETLRSTGVDFLQSGDLWKTLESVPGSPSAAVPRFQAKVFAAFGLRQYYNLRIVDTNQRGTPSDLNATAWDAPEMFTRVDAMVDSLMGVAQLYPFVAFSLGNEVDVYFGAHPGELPAFRALLRREIARVHASRPGIPVGCCTTSPVRNANAWVGDTLNAYTDVRVYTYYPFQPGSEQRGGKPRTVRLQGLPLWGFAIFSNERGDLLDPEGLLPDGDIEDLQGSTNEIVIVAEDTKFTAYANGERLGTQVNSKLAKGAIAFGAFQESGTTTCEYKHTWVWSLDKE